MNHRCLNCFGSLGTLQSAHTFCTTVIKVEVFPGSQVRYAWEIILKNNTKKYRVFVTHQSIRVESLGPCRLPCPYKIVVVTLSSRWAIVLVAHEPPPGECSNHQDLSEGR